MSSSNINLLPPPSGGSAELSAMTAHIRVVGWLVMSLFVATGTMGLIAYVLLRGMASGLEQNKRILTVQIQNLKNVEGLHAIAASRLAIASRILAVQTNHRAVLALTEKVSPDDGIVSISMSQESGRTTVKLTPQNLHDASGTVSTLLSMSNEKKITDATLDSVSLAPDGLVGMTMSFVPIVK